MAISAPVNVKLVNLANLTRALKPETVQKLLLLRATAAGDATLVSVQTLPRPARPPTASMAGSVLIEQPAVRVPAQPAPAQNPVARAYAEAEMPAGREVVSDAGPERPGTATAAPPAGEGRQPPALAEGRALQGPVTMAAGALTTPVSPSARGGGLVAILARAFAERAEKNGEGRLPARTAVLAGLGLAAAVLFALLAFG